MTEIQGWIAIALLLLILVQLVMVGSEMRALRKKLYIEDRRAVPKILRNRLTRGGFVQQQNGRADRRSLGGEISLGAYKDVRYNLRKTLRFPTRFVLG